MAQYGMLIDLERCTGCYSCVISCKQYFGTRPDVDYNQGKFVEWGEFPQAHRRYISTMCNHCEEPPCMLQCPYGATYKTEEGPVLTDPDKCVGCGTCVKACPYGQRFLSKTDETVFPGHPIPAEEESAGRLYKAEKCTLCQSRLELGLEPICTALCPAACRIFGDLTDPESEINYYIKLYGAYKIEGTSLYYVLPEGMDPSVLPRGYDAKTGKMKKTTEANRIAVRKTPDDPAYRDLMDGLIAARDIVRSNNDAPPLGAGEEYRYGHCVMCNHAPRCGIKALVKDGKITRFERRELYGNEQLCAMGNASMLDIYAPDRVLYPLKRTNPKGERSQWKRISWEEALAEIAEKFNGIKEKYGAEKVLFMTGDPKEPRSGLQRLAYTFGSPNFGTESSTCATATMIATKLIYGIDTRAIGSLAMGAAPDVNDTSVALIWGNNPGISAAWSYDKLKTVKEYSRVKYIVVDPRVTSTTESFADVHLQIRPGTDGALALFFANELIRREAYDKEFIGNWAHGFEDYRALCAEYDANRTAEICGVPQALLEKTADLLAERDGPITLKSSASFPQHTNGTDNFRAMQLLIPLTGSLDVDGGHMIANEPLDFDMSGGTLAFARLDAYEKIKHLRVDTDYFPLWKATDIDGNIQINAIPEYVKTGAIKAALMLGGNCMMWGQSHAYQEAFRDMEFVVAVDFRDNPWTHDYVDMLLPAAMSYERSAPLTVVGRRIFLREPIIQPRGEARSDYRICCDIGTALGYGDIFWGGGETADENCIREMLATAGGTRKITLEELREASPNGIIIPLEKPMAYRKWELGLLRKDGKPGFDTPSGKVEFASEVLRVHGLEPLPVYREPTISPVSTPALAKDYPLIMNAGSRVPFFSNAKERELPWLRRYMPEPVVKLSPVDAAARGLSDGDTVRITAPVNPQGIVCKLATTQTLRPGVIDMLHGWPQANVNELIPRDFDPISGFVPFKEGLCQVEKESEEVR